VYPQEGALLWGDTFVIPANSPNPDTAEAFINFLLRPDISAQVTNENSYAVPNDAAWPLILPEIRNNPVIFPSHDSLKNAEIILPLSPQAQSLYQRLWRQALEAAGKELP